MDYRKGRICFIFSRPHPSPFASESVDGERGWDGEENITVTAATILICMAERKRPKPHTRPSPEIVRRARALRRNLTPAEKHLWDQLRNHRFHGLQFRRQHPIYRYIVDFYCARKLLVIEIDGASHAAQEEYDAERTGWLKAHGYKVVRFTNVDVHRNLSGLLRELEKVCGIK